MQHLLHKSQFDQVLGTRTSQVEVVRSEHFYLHRLHIKPEQAELFGGDSVFVGVMTPKRLAKRAVTRNLIKRQVYALCAEQPLKPAAYVVRMRTGFSRAEFPSASSVALKRVVRAELQSLLARFSLAS